jgi:hypothetical protein
MILLVRPLRMSRRLSQGLLLALQVPKPFVSSATGRHHRLGRMKYDQRRIHGQPQFCQSESVMGPRQGRPLSAEKIEKMKELLATSDLSIAEIAARMGCSPGRVGSINRKLRIRLFEKKRTSWVVNE